MENLIIVVGKSKDSTGELAEKYGDIVVQDHGEGIGEARQVGLKNVRTSFFAFVDADVIVTSEWGRWCSETIEHPKVGACEGVAVPIGKYSAMTVEESNSHRARRPGCGRRDGPRSAPSGRAGWRSWSLTEGWTHEHLLEAALERGVLFDVLAVLVQGGRTDQWSSPRASMGFSMLPASIAPSAPPAPTTVCSSSTKGMTSPSESVISLRTAFRRSSNSPRYFAPAISEPRSRPRPACP